jgi:hypothetical protein
MQGNSGRRNITGMTGNIKWQRLWCGVRLRKTDNSQQQKREKAGTFFKHKAFCNRTANLRINPLPALIIYQQKPVNSIIDGLNHME